MRTWLKTLGISVLAIFAPTYPILITVLTLVFLDSLLQICLIMTGKTAHEVDYWASVGLKLFFYDLIIIVAFLVGNYLTKEFFPVLNVVTTMIGIAELKTILGKVGELSGSPLFGRVSKHILGEDA